MLPQHVLLAALGDKGSKAQGALQERGLTLQTSSQTPKCLKKGQPSTEHGTWGASVFKRINFGADALKLLMQENTSFSKEQKVHTLPPITASRCAPDWLYF